MREIFQRIEDNTTINIEVDMNAYGYSQKYTWLFSVFIKFDVEEGDTLDYEEFLETKESLIIALEYEKKAKFVGLRIVDGWSEFYFYAESSKNLNNIVSKMLTPSHYIYESNVVKDTKWDFHHKFLSPTDLELAHIQSEKILFLLEEEGDDLTLARPVEHYISFTTPTQKNRFLNTLDLDGFVFKDEIESDAFEYGIALLKEHNLVRENIQKIIEVLFEVIQKEDGFYEGWSTTLASEIATNE